MGLFHARPSFEVTQLAGARARIERDGHGHGEHSRCTAAHSAACNPRV